MDRVEGRSKPLSLSPDVRLFSLAHVTARSNLVPKLSPAQWVPKWASFAYYPGGGGGGLHHLLFLCWSICLSLCL